jgi:hypothetical protein
LYTEPIDEAPLSGELARGRWRTSVHAVHQWWIGAVEAAGRVHRSAGRLERVQHWAVRVAADAIAEQRTLWSLRHAVPASLLHPADLTGPAAAELRDHLLVAAGRRHGRWLGVYALAFAASGLVMVIPGPNLLAYYFAVHLASHYLSWRGARSALDHTTWDARAEPALGELASLASAEPSARGPRVEAIARALNLPQLPAFFERAATPVR